MNLDLTSSIKLNSVPASHYHPQGDVAAAELTRFEKVYTSIFDNLADGSEYIARHVARLINKNVLAKGRAVLALGADRGMAGVYQRLAEMVEAGELTFKDVVIYNTCEFFPLTPAGPSTMASLRDMLIDHIDIPAENVHSFTPDCTVREEMYLYCKRYEEMIARDGGIDLALVQIGPQGSLAWNPPGSPATAGTRLVLLNGEIRQRLAATYQADSVPSTALTLGTRDILGAERIIAAAWGDNYAAIVQSAVEGEVTGDLPASFLQLHSGVRLAVDLPAAENLTRISMPWKVASPQWDDKLTRRAVVWLCGITGKPILKLTNRDYADNGLDDLAALHNGAYNVNIRVFNQLQRTITGWPGGKPNADDAIRPEREKPYPKRVIVFSPHPDDDVISMGGTLRRLVEQGHDVHVAYQTSGNIAVADEDLWRYLLLMKRMAPSERVDTAEAFLDAKQPDDIDTPDVREMKTIIREGEATIACRYVGVKRDNIHFLRLPFYETGTIKKGDLAERDVKIVMDLLQEVKPHQIFVAGDLADPHGTHRVCTNAVLAALDELKEEAWMDDCRVWMYRGAWAEWEIDHIEMAVPMSPEQLRFKRNSILKHQSQMENAPFLGDDDRLFWQRSEDRNRATACLYEDLGLASYEAIEAFVQYHPKA